MTSFQALRLIHRWLHPTPPEPELPELPEHRPPLVSEHQGWLRQVGENKTFLRGSQHYVFLQPDISGLCRQWLATEPETEPEPQP